MAEPQIRYATTSDGVNIAYFTMGNGVPFVQIQFPVSNLQHELTAPWFREAYEQSSREATLVRYDHRGLGISDKHNDEFSTSDFVRDLEAVVDKLALRRFFLFASQGSSYPIAMAYTALHPERVLSIAAVVGGPTADFTSAISDMPDADWRFISDTLARRISGDPKGAEELAEDIRQSMDLDGLRRFNTWFSRASEEVVAEAVHVPCLLVPMRSGGRDWIADARALAARMPNAVVQPITGATAQGAGELRDAIRTFFGGRQAAPAPSAPEPPAAAPGTAASTTAVILFTDIADSTALTERLGDAAFRAASRALDEHIRRAIRETNGTPVDGKVLGDGVMGVFSSAAQAIEAARRCVAVSSEAELPLHIGVHAGDVIREDDNVYGGAVNIASRICGLCDPGEVLVSDTVRGLARTSAGVTFEDRGEHALKGIAEPQRVFAVRASEAT